MEIKPVDSHWLPKILPLIREYQDFYGFEVSDEKNFSFFIRLVERPEQGRQFVAIRDGVAVGFATLYFLPSSLSGQNYCVLNDLFTLRIERGTGVGRALIEHCRRYARAEGFESMEWQTQRQNITAQILYDSLNASKTEWYTYSLRT